MFQFLIYMILNQYYLASQSQIWSRFEFVVNFFASTLPKILLLIYIYSNNQLKNTLLPPPSTHAPVPLPISTSSFQSQWNVKSRKLSKIFRLFIHYIFKRKGLLPFFLKKKKNRDKRLVLRTIRRNVKIGNYRVIDNIHIQIIKGNNARS